MKNFGITLKSKNIISMNNFLIYLKKVLKFYFNILIKDSKKNIKKKTLTILKSPHVNKNAQEHFEIKAFKTVLFVSVSATFKLWFFFKHLSLNSLSDISFKAILLINRQFKFKMFNINSFKISKYCSFGLNNVYLQQFKQKTILSKSSLITKSRFLFKIFDLHSEILIKNNFNKFIV